jgi:hypothetical protein
VSSDYTQARLQRIEAHLRNLDQKVSVLSAVDDPAVKQRIDETFGQDPRAALIYRGVQRGMTQQDIAEALKERGLAGATQPRVSETLTILAERGFVQRKKAGFVIRDGWDDFGLDRTLKRLLKKHKINDLV